MHIIGFSHHYEKIHRQTHGVLLSVRSTKPLEHRPDAEGIGYDTRYFNPLQYKIWAGEYKLKPREWFEEYLHYPLTKEDFDKPLLQLVFIGNKQIPFTTYRHFPKNYKPFHPGRRTYRKSLPYSDLIGDIFAFKFKGAELPEGLANKICTRPKSHAEIFN